MKTDKLKRETLKSARGDLLLSRAALPQADSILHLRKGAKHPVLVKSHLEDYLRFLELVVLNERLIVGSYDFSTELPSEVANMWREEFLYVGGSSPMEASDFYDQIMATLRSESILFECHIQVENLSLIDFVERKIETSDQFKARFNEEYNRAKKMSKGDPKLFATQQLAVDFAMPIYIGDFARQAKIPYMISEGEVSKIRWLEEAEVQLHRGVLAGLKNALDRGAENQLAALKRVGVSTVFPETPIAGWIVQESHRPEDMLIVALELRRNLVSFRKRMCELETILVNDNSSVQEKSEAAHSLELAARELCPEENLCARKITLELSDLVNECSGILADLGTGNVAEAVKHFLGFPVEALIRALQRRKVREMMRFRRKFLLRRAHVAKLAAVFKLQKSDVLKALSSEQDPYLY